MRILIAEDERITRASLTRQLESWGHAVVAVEDGEKAWEQYQAGGFDIVVTDWEMPRLTGVELIQRIRESPGATYVYVILLTSRSDKSDIVRGIEAGADDFVSKPFDRDELRVRLLAGERIVSLERALSRQNVELRNANDRIRHGLQAAARVQRSMLPQRTIRTAQVSTAWHYVPSEELAGDAIGLHMIDDRYLVAYVIDVSGHGVPAALLSVTAMHALEPMAGPASLLRDMTGAGSMGTVRRPAQVAHEMNRRFMAADNDGRYLTMILCILDTRTGQLHLTSAGHPPPLILRAGDCVACPDAGGLPIATFDDAEYEDATVQLNPGDRIILYSDGVTEQFDPAGDEQFGEERLLAFLQQHSQTPPETLVRQAVDALSAWAKVENFIDDVSIVAVEWIGPVED